jgi:hypothetical protein
MYKTCPNCEKNFKARASKQKYCSMACYKTWRKAHANRSEEARKKRRVDLLRKRIRGRISEEEYERKRDQLREDGLI